MLLNKQITSMNPWGCQCRNGRQCQFGACGDSITAQQSAHHNDRHIKRLGKGFGGVPSARNGRRNLTLWALRLQ